MFRIPGPTPGLPGDLTGRVWLLIVWGGIPGGLLLALHSGIPAGGSVGTLCDAGGQSCVGHVQGNGLTHCTISLGRYSMFQIKWEEGVRKGDSTRVK